MVQTEPTEMLRTQALLRSAWPQRAWSLLAGPRFARRLLVVHAVDDIGDALVNLSLVGSLFISVSFDASRERILLYLILTTLPLAVIAPAMGTFLGRSSAGFRVVIVGSEFVRVALAITMASSLNSVALYPLMFGVLLSRKGYGLAKTTLLSTLAPDQHALVQASGHLARVGQLTQGVGTSAGAVLYVTVGPSSLLLLASVMYVCSGFIAFRLPDPQLDLGPTGRGQSDVPVDVMWPIVALATLRTASGALTYLLAFAIKRGGGQAWFFGAGLVATGVGAFIGTLAAAPLLRRVEPIPLMSGLLFMPAIVTGLTVVSVGNAGVIVTAASIGLANSIATRTIDVVRSRAPDLARGRLVARSELQFQIAGLLGAVLAVWFTPVPRIGFAAVSLLLFAFAILFTSRARSGVRTLLARLLVGEQSPMVAASLPAALLAESRRLSVLGASRMAITVADTAVRAAHAVTPPQADSPSMIAWRSLDSEIGEVIRADREPPAELVVHVQEAAQRILDEAALPSEPPPHEPTDTEWPAL
jgi:hypothetical protein